MALQLRRAKTDWSGCCQMTAQGALWLAKRLSLNLNFSFLNRIRYFSYQVATQLSPRDWVDPVPDPILPEKFLGYSRESNPGPLGWQSEVLTTIPNRWSLVFVIFSNISLIITLTHVVKSLHVTSLFPDYDDSPLVRRNFQNAVRLHHTGLARGSCESHVSLPRQ